MVLLCQPPEVWGYRHGPPLLLVAYDRKESATVKVKAMSSELCCECLTHQQREGKAEDAFRSSHCLF